MGQVRVMRYVDCPFSAVMETAESVMERRSDWYVTPSPMLAERVRMAAKNIDDLSDEVRRHDALIIAWRPHQKRLFPEFRGVLTARPKARGVWLRLSGSYTAPFGAAGKAFDFAIGRGIALLTMRRFLEELGTGIEREFSKRRQSRTA